MEATSHTLRLPNLSAPSAGIKLAHLTDLHARDQSSYSQIEQAIAMVNEWSPDLVVITGDFVESGNAHAGAALKLLSALCPEGRVYAVLGNHDHRGAEQVIRSKAARYGVHLLQNDAIEALPGLWFAGIDDLYEGKPDLDAALRALPEESAAILLSHHPDAMDRVPPDRPLTILSGHTHGGQLSLRFPNPKWICKLHLRTNYVAGWYRRGAVQMYVSRGLGVAGPWPLNRRVRCPAEVSLFTLLPGK